MEIDPRAWTAVTLAILALWLAVPREDALLIPQRRRGPLEWLRYRLSRPARDAQEERDAARFLARMKEPDPPVYRIRQRDLPSVNRRIDTVLLAGGDQVPWRIAPYAPDPEDDELFRPEEPQERAQEEPQEQAQEDAQLEPEAQEEAPLSELRAWSPGDPGKTPTGVLRKITPEVERQLRPYLDRLPRYEDEPGQ